MPLTIRSTLLAHLLLPLALPGCSDDRDREPWKGEKTVALVQYQTCDALESDIKARARLELDAYIDSYGYYGGGGAPSAPGTDDGDAAGGDGGGEAGDGGSREEGTDYSGTNNQEEGVDEADLVKTDGFNLYLVNGNRLHVFGVPEFGSLVASSELELEGEPYQLLLDSESGRAAVFSFVAVETLPEEHPVRERVQRSDGDASMPYRTYGLSKVTVFDVTDPTEPILDREVWIEGWYQTARRIDSSIRVVANGYILVPGLDDFWSLFYTENGGQVDLEQVRKVAEARIDGARLDDMIPRLYERLPDGELRTVSIAGSDCGSFYRPTDSAGRTTSTILSFDISAPELTVDTETVVSNWATVYSSSERLYLAESAWDWWWGWTEVEPGEVFTPATNIHAFDITEPGQSTYVGSGRIDGTVINQFALDEQDGRLRVAASTTPFVAWGVAEDGEVFDQTPPAPESHIYVLEERNGELDTVGHLGGIAPNEQIFAARFMKDEAFLVTFEQIDPLFTIDLSEPTAPRLVGELEVPGFSTYLHPIADDRILSIGVGGDENGANWNMQVSLFDVSDRAAPALVDAEELTNDGWSSWSEALYEHKAFQYFAPKKLLAVPMSGYTGEGDGAYIWHSRLELVNVDPESGLDRRGVIDHSRFFEGDDAWWGSPDVRRSVFMGDYIYAISSRAVTVHSLDDLSEVAAEQLPLPSPPYWWW
jgi:hypothetical protein